MIMLRIEITNNVSSTVTASTSLVVTVFLFTAILEYTESYTTYKSETIT